MGLLNAYFEVQSTLKKLTPWKKMLIIELRRHIKMTYKIS